jgi:hypothetical protein
MIEFIPGNTYVLALLITQQTDPTGLKSPAAALSPLIAFITATPIDGTSSIDEAALVQAVGSEIGDYTMPDGITVARKYLATFLGADNRLPFSQLITDGRNRQVYVYTAFGEDLLEPTLGLIVATKPHRR